MAAPDIQVATAVLRQELQAVEVLPEIAVGLYEAALCCRVLSTAQLLDRQSDA